MDVSIVIVVALLTLENVDDLIIDADHMMAISPDEGATRRAIDLANMLGLDMGMFYKRRDYSRVVDGRNPIIAHEFLGSPVAGKDVVILDDMISSGETVLEIAHELNKRKAARIFICATFGIFSTGLDDFDKAHKEGIFHSILTTNLSYQRPELFTRDWYHSCDLSKFLALIIDTLNHDGSLSDLLDPVDRINTFLEKMNVKRK